MSPAVELEQLRTAQVGAIARSDDIVVATANGKHGHGQPFLLRQVERVQPRRSGLQLLAEKTTEIVRERRAVMGCAQGDELTDALRINRTHQITCDQTAA